MCKLPKTLVITTINVNACSIFSSTTSWNKMRVINVSARNLHIFPISKGNACVCVFGFNVAFNNFSVISRLCLVATWSSMFTFIVLPH